METEEDTPLSRKLIFLLQSVQTLYNPEDTLEGTERDENDPFSGESVNMNSSNIDMMVRKYEHMNMYICIHIYTCICVYNYVYIDIYVYLCICI
jgi:hypothetical protein